MDEINEEENIMTSNHWVLPARGLHGLWDRYSALIFDASITLECYQQAKNSSLVFEEEIKQRLLDYVYTSMLFADKGVDMNLINVNRVALFHGPPGECNQFG